MNRGIADWAWAFVAAIVLLAAAAIVVFVLHPGGSQVGWYAGLLPGSIVAALLGDFVQNLAPHFQRTIYMAETLAISFLCYFLVAFIVIKIVRAAASPRKA